MKLLSYSLLIAILLAGFQTPGLQAQKKGSTQDSKKIKLEESPLSKQSEHLKDIFKLQWKDEQLEIDKEHWKTVAKKSRIRDPYSSYFRRSRFPADAQHVSTLFHAVTSKLRNRGTSISSSGGAFTRVARSTELESKLSVDENNVVLEFQEQSDTNRMLSLRLTKDGKFRIMLLGDDELLILDQMKKGRVRIVCDIGNGPRVYTGKSFREFAKTDTTVMSTELGLVMEHFGIAKPILPMDQAVKKAVWAKLELLGNENIQQQFDALVKQLNSGEFTVRQTATDAINQKYELFVVAIGAEMKKPDISPECKSRLTTIIRLNARSNQIADVIRGFELLDSADYLIRLGQSNPEKPEMKLLIKQLRKITNHDAGDRIDDWVKWASKKEAKD